LRQTLGGQRGTRGVAAQALEPTPVSRGYANVGVQADPVDDRAALAPHRGYIFDVHVVAKAHNPLAGAASRGDAATHGSGVERGEQRMLPADRVDLLWIVVGSEPAALQ